MSKSYEFTCMLVFRVFVIVASYLLLMSCVVLLVISGVAFGWFKQTDLLLFSVNIDYKLLFGIGIGVSLICFIGLWVFFAVPLFKVNFIVTFPLLYAIPCVYLYYSCPASIQTYLRVWDAMWDPELVSVEDLQMIYHCCGWSNATDRSLVPCPFNYHSGCYGTVSKYVEERLEQVLHASALSLCLSVISSAFLFYFINKNSDTTIISQLQVS